MATTIRPAVAVESYAEGEVWVCAKHIRVPAHPRFRPAPGAPCDRCRREADTREEG